MDNQRDHFVSPFLQRPLRDLSQARTDIQATRPGRAEQGHLNDSGQG